eukprot:jgi/Picsp_1/217/NSC_00216-R1_ubiquitin family protein
MYIRVKRERATYFLEVEASDTVNRVKELLQGLVDGAQGSDSMALVKDGSTLDGFKTLVDSKIENDAVLCLVLKKQDGSFEVPHIVTFDEDDEDEQQQLQDTDQP